MRKLGMIVVLGVAGLVVACGSSSSGSDSGAGGAAGASASGGAAGGLATGGTAGGGTSGSCNMPTCLSTALTGCEPSGTCVQQSSTTSFDTNNCYSNGVKVITTVDLSTYAVSVTFKSPTKTCLTMSGTGDLSGKTTLTMKNSSGTTIGTLSEDTAASVTTVTCTGGQPVTLDPSCDFGTSSDAGCTDGACAP
jgi:hypothetical protein